ncbi:hypothetical protein LCGC14_1928220 [marine sediment metagenome]|uniref:Uncharacterized protein n=1 Tax=marine sediment metagenome TaxID=412755 RepID=A0A0F9GC47_9ZZZZ
MKPLEAAWKEAALDSSSWWCTHCTPVLIEAPPTFGCTFSGVTPLESPFKGDEPCLTPDWTGCPLNKDRE